MEALVVVVGLDGSDGSLAALAVAARQADLAGHRIVAVHVVRAHPLVTTAPVSGAGALAVTDDEVVDRCHLDCEVVWPAPMSGGGSRFAAVIRSPSWPGLRPTTTRAGLPSGAARGDASPADHARP